MGPGTGFVGVGIIGTEVTTFLPVAFREAVRSKKISKAQVSSVLGVLFPLAFCWRTYWSSKLWVRLLGVGRNYIATKQPNLLNLALWRLGEASVLTVVCSNVVWTCRIAKGSLGVVKKKLTGKKTKSKSIPEGNPVSERVSECIQYCSGKKNK